MQQRKFSEIAYAERKCVLQNKKISFKIFLNFWFVLFQDKMNKSWIMNYIIFNVLFYHLKTTLNKSRKLLSLKQGLG